MSDWTKQIAVAISGQASYRGLEDGWARGLIAACKSLLIISVLNNHIGKLGSGKAGSKDTHVNI